MKIENENKIGNEHYPLLEVRTFSKGRGREYRQKVIVPVQ